MPNIRVKLFANFREFAGTKELELEGNTVAEILEILCAKFPGMEKMIFKGGKVHPYINIFLNGKDIKDILEHGGTTLHQDDEIAVFPPVSGG
ncbi:MAG: MoaD/ThiS family protein [Candidatus Methanoperedens sp.]|nr:MoaD/ThiS family protein [Candidatus Methanoperedens sp.]